MAQAQLAGTPGVYNSVTDASQIPANVQAGKICVQGIFKRGKGDKVYYCANPQDFYQRFGGVISGNKDAQVILRALNKGAKLFVHRVNHYATITDASTVAGTKASGTITSGTTTAEVKAYTTLVVTGAGSENDTLLIKVDRNGTFVTFATVTVPATPTTSTVATAIRNAINSTSGNGTAEHGYVASGSGANVIITQPAGLGAAGNAYDLKTTITGTATVNSTNLDFANGVTAVAAVVADISADEVGSGYNGTVVTISNSISGIADKVDIKVVVPDAPNAIEVKNYDKVLTENTCDTLNRLLDMVEIDFDSLVSDTLPIGTCTLTGGAQDISAIVATDHIGSSVSGLGFYAFDDVSDSMRIFNFSNTDPSVAQALADYCEARKDMRFHTVTPLGLAKNVVGDYRKGTGSYSHQPIDSFYGRLFYADGIINNPDNPADSNYAISLIGDQMALRAICDATGAPFRSDSGYEFGRLSGVNGLPVNFLAGGNKAIYDVIYDQNGVNAIVNHPTFKIVNWGNRSLYLNQTSLLSKDNIADLVVYAGNVLKQLSEIKAFQPDDIEMWNELYRKVRPFIVDELVNKRGIAGKGTANDGEGIWWHWLGDQFAKDLNDLKFNNKAEVDAGKYRARFAMKPNAATEYIGIDIAPGDSATIQNISILLTV